MFRCYSYTIIRERNNLCLLKLRFLKYSIKIHRCVVDMVGVWLHILGPYWCLYVALFGSRKTNTLPDDGVTVTPKHVGAVLM